MNEPITYGMSLCEIGMQGDIILLLLRWPFDCPAL